jgi:hypothetical protein
LKKMCSALVACTCILIASLSVVAQEPSKPTTKTPPAISGSKAGNEYSGMYSFLEDGEFVQITVEDDGKVTGYVSRYGEGGSDKGVFVDHFFRSGKLEGNKIAFTTATVDSLWFDFKGTVERGEGKNPGDEAYYVLQGTLTDNRLDAAKKITTHSREVVLKMFPAVPST